MIETPHLGAYAWHSPEGAQRGTDEYFAYILKIMNEAKK